MDDQNSVKMVNWLEISDSLDRMVVFLNKIIGTLESFQELVELESDFVNKKNINDLIDEAMRDLFVAKNRIILFAKKNCVSGPISDEWYDKRDDLVLCMDLAAKKFSCTHTEVSRKIREANFREDDDFSG